MAIFVTDTSSATPVSSDLTPLPVRHASMETHPASEQQILSIPLDGLTGRVTISARVEMVDGGPDRGGNAGLMDRVDAPAADYRGTFKLAAGSYVCKVTVKEQASGKTYVETLRFLVK